VAADMAEMSEVKTSSIESSTSLMWDMSAFFLVAVPS
jgi:hypothetical protein